MFVALYYLHAAYAFHTYFIFATPGCMSTFYGKHTGIYNIRKQFFCVRGCHIIIQHVPGNNTIFIYTV